MSKNLVIKMSNGFGNQMFLYAAAYGFSKKLGYNLLIDNESGIKHDFKKWEKKKKDKLETQLRIRVVLS
tara:strand:+ start:5360 stop:5566 length:207 start_codon:yes stop_codon:yes gene_type:complete